MKPGSKPVGKKVRASASLSRLSYLVVLFLIVEIAAIGVKGWDDIKNGNELERARLSTELGSIQARFEDARNHLETSLNLANAAGLGTLEIETHLKNASRVFRIAPEEQRAGLADAESLSVARYLAKNDQNFGITSRDLIVLSRQNGRAYAASFPLRSEIGAIAKDEALRLTQSAPDIINAIFGSSQVLNRIDTGLFDTQQGFDHFWTNYTSTCTTMSDSAVELCKVSARPWFTILGTGAVLAYSALVLAPVLGLLSLLGFLRSRAGSARTSPASAKSATEAADAEFSVDFFKSNTAFQELSRRFGSSTWEVDSEFRIFRATGQLAELMQVQPGSNIPLADLPNYWGEDAGQRFITAVKKGAQEGALKGALGLDINGTRRFIEFRAFAPGTIAHSPIALTGIAIDLTERRAMEERMKISESRLRGALEGFSLPIAMWDQRKRLIFWNKAFENTFNLHDDILRIGMAYEQLNIEMSSSIRTERSKTQSGNEREIMLLDGRWLSLSERETASGLIVMFGNDISALKNQQDEHIRNTKQLKRLVTELERSEGRANELTRKYSEEKTKAEHASQAKGSFLANMSHELRTPLNAINGFSEMLVKEVFGPLGDARYQSYAQDILVSGQHLLDMINDILDMAKIESGKMTINTKPIDPVDPCDAAIRMIRRKADEKSIKLDLVYSKDLAEIEADHRAVRQMVLNLVSNAIKFTRDGGNVTVSLFNAAQFIAIEVRDTGVGIAKDDLPKLANPFEQSQANQDMNPNGTGLGLALTRSLAEMHGGRFEIDSELGVGTTATLYLPLQQPDEDTSDEAA